MEDMIYIFGHKNPDTDSICSSIAYAELKRLLGADAAAFRIGKINKETQFVLSYFEVAVPPLLSDVKIRVKDLKLYQPKKVNSNSSIKKAYEFMKINVGAKIIPITEDDGVLAGIISLEDITKMFVDANDEDITAKYEILFENLIETIEGRLYFGKYKFPALCGRLIIGSSNIDAKALTGKDIVITPNYDVARSIAEESDCGCIILADKTKAEGIKSKGCAIITTDFSVYKTANLINLAVSLSSVMKKNNIVTILEDSYVEDIIDLMKTSSHRNFPVINHEGKIVGIISRRHLIESEKKKVILMDHNEKHQSIEGLDEANILEIIDHHRIADIQTDTPLYLRAEPLGSTCTIVYKMYLGHGIDIPKKIAGILLSAILSDTLMFTSPTCTETDVKAGEELAKIAGVDINEYGKLMFRMSTSLEEYTPEQILGIDRKQFMFDKYIAYISQVNTMDMSTINYLRDELTEAMGKFAADNNADLVILMVTDIINKGSELLVVGKAKELVSKAFAVEIDKNRVYLSDVVSRKKQVVPQLALAAQIG